MASAMPLRVGPHVVEGCLASFPCHAGHHGGPEPARVDAFEFLRLDGHIQGNPMRAHPVLDGHANAGDLLASLRRPNPGGVRADLGGDAEVSQQVDGKGFDALHPGAHIPVSFAEVDNWVDDKLPRAMQGRLAATLNGVDGETLVEHVACLSTAPQCGREGVLDKQKCILCAAGNPLVPQLALQGKALAVVHAPQIAHLHVPSTPHGAFRFGTAASSGTPGVRAPMRAWPWLALVAILASPLVAAQDPFVLPAGSFRSIPLQAQDGSQFDISFHAEQAIDVVLVQETDAEYGNATHVAAVLNQTQGILEGSFPAPGRWVLVIDNSDAIAGGANGSLNATITMELTIRHVIPAPLPTPIDDAGSSNPWPVLMLTAPYWDLAVIGLGGMALWFLLLGALVAVRYNAGWDKVAVLTVGSAILLVLWDFLPRTGPVANIFLPLLVAAGVAWLATRGTPDGLQAARMAFISGGLGALLGGTLAHLLRLVWSDPADLLLGAGRFDDPVFMLPVAAGGGALLLAVVKALVEASEDDEEPAAAPAEGGLTTTFTVGCIRCATPITVDRSMKRYRVATDRYEFSCPNCHNWMEWAEPNPAT